MRYGLHEPDITPFGEVQNENVVTLETTVLRLLARQGVFMSVEQDGEGAQRNQGVVLSHVGPHR